MDLQGIPVVLSVLHDERGNDGVKRAFSRLQRIGMTGIEANGDRLTVGAMTRLQTIVDDARTPDLVRAAALRAGPNTLRNSATIGGAVVTASPESELVAALLVCGATVQVEARGGVTVAPLAQFLANTPAMLELALALRPAFVCLVPENRQEITTEGGLDAAAQVGTLEPTLRTLQGEGMKVSLFIDPDPEQVRASSATGADAVELHTGEYANARGAEERDACLAQLRDDTQSLSLQFAVFVPQVPSALVQHLLFGHGDCQMIEQLLRV